VPSIGYSSIWSLWSEWSMCNCNKPEEFRFRIRECRNSMTSASVKNEECAGPYKEVKPCDKTHCQTQSQSYPAQPFDYSQQSSQTTTLSSAALTQLPHSFMIFPTTSTPSTISSEWSEWSSCSAKCGMGSRTRIRHCSKEKLDFPCEGSELIMERGSCSSFVNCTDVWTEWNSWSSCSVGCGDGFSYRKRVCNGSRCIGPANEVKPCSSHVNCTNSIQSISDKSEGYKIEERTQTNNLNNNNNNNINNNNYYGNSNYYNNRNFNYGSNFNSIDANKNLNNFSPTYFNNLNSQSVNTNNKTNSIYNLGYGGLSSQSNKKVNNSDSYGLNSYKNSYSYSNNQNSVNSRWEICATLCNHTAKLENPICHKYNCIQNETSNTSK
jgi:hypothetical protein